MPLKPVLGVRDVTLFTTTHEQSENVVLFTTIVNSQEIMHYSLPLINNKEMLYYSLPLSLNNQLCNFDFYNFALCAEGSPFFGYFLYNNAITTCVFCKTKSNFQKIH